MKWIMLCTIVRCIAGAGAGAAAAVGCAYANAPLLGLCVAVMILYT